MIYLKFSEKASQWIKKPQFPVKTSFLRSGLSFFRKRLPEKKIKRRNVFFSFQNSEASSKILHMEKDFFNNDNKNRSL